jgi:hypothetical protein
MLAIDFVDDNYITHMLMTHEIGRFGNRGVAGCEHHVTVT